MGALNYSNVDSSEFERLAKDMMSKKLNIPLKNFGPGKDKGIDLTEDVTVHKIIVQCKLYPKTGSKGVVDVFIRQELQKIKELNPEQYYIFTSENLTIGQKSKLREAFQGFLSSDDNIIDNVEIENFFNDPENVDVLVKHLDYFIALPKWYSLQPSIPVYNSLNDYYQEEIETCEAENTSKNQVIVGPMSLIEAYIDPYILKDNKSISLMDAIEEWVSHTPYGIKLIHGQPGHGKTTFCRKAVYDFCQKEHFQNMSAVLQFPLRKWNIEKASEENLLLDSIFVFHPYDHDIQVTTIRELPEHSLLILDGFDEIKLRLSKIKIENYQEFKDALYPIAKKKKIYIIVTSRTNAVKGEDGFEFSLLSSEQQGKWCSKFPDYQQRWEKYYKNVATQEYPNDIMKDFQNLLKIPFIFRMVIHSNYQIHGKNTNKARLYKELFDQTMKRIYTHKSDSVKIDNLNQLYQELSYKIWCHNDDTAIINNDETTDIDGIGSVKKSEYLLFSYYTKEIDTNQQRKTIGFLHRSFYQYYFSLYLHEEMRKCTRETGESFLKKLADRPLDDDTLCFFQEIMDNEHTENELRQNAQILLEIMDKTQCILPSSVNSKNGNAANAPYDRCNYIFKNALNLFALFDISDFLNHSKFLRELIGKYDCSNTHIERIEFQDANLSGAHLAHSFLNEATLSGINLSRADLSYADFSGKKTNLSHVDLSHADLSNANLTGCNLSNANLLDANLSYANLSYANLSFANLHNVNRKGTIFTNVIGLPTVKW